jgi:rare lipoprotein A (peptidoglycan hydrolase)
VPAPALADTQGTQPTVSIARVGVAKERLHVRLGRSVAVVGTVQPAAAGYTARLQVWRKGRWRTIDRDRTSASGRYALRDRMHRTMSAPARVLVRGGGDRHHRHIGRVNVYREALASWYGPGFYGNRTGCGGRLGYSQLGVAHKTLPCGSKVTLRHRGRSLRVKVIDRGPYVGAREYDLTAATARKLRFRGHGGILSTR